MASYTSNNILNSNARDSVLLYQLTNDVGATFGLEQDGNSFLLQLISKSGKILDERRISFDIPDEKELTQVFLRPETKTLTFKFSNGEKLSCSVIDIYNGLDTLDNKLNLKQDILIPGQGIIISNGIISVDPATAANIGYEVVGEDYKPIIPDRALLSENGDILLGEVDDRLTELLF